MSDGDGVDHSGAAVPLVPLQQQPWQRIRRKWLLTAHNFIFSPISNLYFQFRASTDVFCLTPWLRDVGRSIYIYVGPLSIVVLSSFLNINSHIQAFASSSSPFLPFFSLTITLSLSHHTTKQNTTLPNLAKLPPTPSMTEHIPSSSLDEEKLSKMADSTTDRPTSNSSVASFKNDISDDAVPETVYPTGFRMAAIVVALALGIFLVALDMTIVATAIPKITDTKGFEGLDLIAWYSSGFFLTLGSFQSTWYAPFPPIPPFPWPLSHCSEQQLTPTPGAKSTNTSP